MIRTSGFRNVKYRPFLAFRDQQGDSHFDLYYRGSRDENFEARQKRRRKNAENAIYDRYYMKTGRWPE